MRISDWSSDVCSSDLADVEGGPGDGHRDGVGPHPERARAVGFDLEERLAAQQVDGPAIGRIVRGHSALRTEMDDRAIGERHLARLTDPCDDIRLRPHPPVREHEYGRASCRAEVGQYV